MLPRILGKLRNSVAMNEPPPPPRSTLFPYTTLFRSLSRYGDINMMMTANGQERTEAQWRKLVEETGWKIDRIYPLRNAWVQAIDLRPA